MPMLAASVSLQAGAVPKGTVQDINELNKTLRFGKSQGDVTIKFLAKEIDENKGTINSLENMTLVCYADAGFGTRRDGSSQGGFIIMACDKAVHNGIKVPASTVAWRSFKLPRVCRSSLGAECQATATALEELLMAKTFLEALKKPDCDLKNIKDQLTGVSAMVTDCKALYDAVYRETIQQATDKRVAIEGLVIKETLRDLNCSWRWVSSERQLADGLTKISARQAFTERYKGHYIQLVADESYQAAKKKSQEERQKTVQETRRTSSKVAEALIGMVMTSQIIGANAREDQCKTDIEHVSINVDLFDLATILMIMLMILAIFMLAWKCKPKKKKKAEPADESEEEPVPELEPIDHGEEDDVMGNIVNELVEKNESLQAQVKELERKVSYLSALLQKREKKENGLATYSHMPEEVFTTPTVEVTWVKKEELQEGDELFYCGPSMASNSLVERGAVCTLRGGSNSHRDYTLVFFPQANTSLVVHRLHLSRSPPNAVPLPAGCDVGETFFYCGPLRRIGGRVLTPGARGEVVEAGLLEGSLRLRFQGFGFTLFSVEMQNLSKEAPRGPDGRFWRAGCAGCYTRTDENWIRPVVRKPDTDGFFNL
eukprot:g17943.t1